MARPKSRKPAYCLHKPSGRAYVKIDGRRTYLGRHGTPESRDAYDRVIGEWIARGRTAAPPLPHLASTHPVVVAEVVNQFRAHAEAYYRNESGHRGGEAANFKLALRPLVRLYGRMPAAEFGPLKLEVLAAEMVRLDWCRPYINRQLARIKQVFKWAAGRELVPACVYHSLATFGGLRKGKSDAREAEPVACVPDAMIDAVLPHLPRPVKAMVQLQRLTGMRPGEACMMRPCDIDMSNPSLWEYRPPSHKTEHHGHDRLIPLGRRCQELITPFLAGRVTNAYLFSPSEAEAERNAAKRVARRTPMTPSQAARRPAVERARPPGDYYDKDSYRRAIIRGCDRAFPVPAGLRAELDGAATPEAANAAQDRVREWRRQHRWHPHQIRHTASTELRRRYGLEAAQVILGHRTLTTTQIYAEKNVETARRIMAEVG